MLTNWEGFLPIEGVVIIVEDDDMLRALLIQIIKDLGAAHHAFASADEALMHMLAKPEDFALVVTDHGVPGQIKGAEYLHMVAQRWPQLPTILTSGYELEASVVPEGTLYIQKPWTIDNLVIALASLLQPGVPVQRI